ncbi:MAG: metallophosphoesterase [Candidatus Latescibacteria bacterium]|nr:metallophosphoesterase [Candidatus Latescibacterota bacterium]
MNKQRAQPGLHSSFIFHRSAFSEKRGGRFTIFWLVLYVLGWCVLSPACSPARVRYDILGAVLRLSPPQIAPLPPQTPRLTFLVFGDWGTGGNSQRAVADGMAGIVARTDRGADFVIGTGDNFYPDGVTGIDDPQWQSKFEQVYDPGRFPISFFMVLGNHDYRGNVAAQVAYHRKGTGRWSMEARYYTFSKAVTESTAVQFFALDTTMLLQDSTAAEHAQLAWFERELATSRARWKIVVSHHPLFSNGKHGDAEQLLFWLVPLLERYGVQAVFSGHDHALQAIRPSNGVHYFVSGAGARPRSVRWRWNTLFASASPGFAWCRLTHDELLVVFCDQTGRELWARSIGPPR